MPPDLSRNALSPRGETRFGLVGTGYWATVGHAAGIAAHPHATLIGVWGRDPAASETLARLHGARAYSDVDELFSAVDAVAFAVPPDIQARLALRAAKAGKALLLEKPLAIDLAAARRLVEAIDAPTVVFFTSRFDPGVATWFRRIEERNWDGAAVRVLVSLLEGDSPFSGSAWRRQHGALWDAGPHALAMVIPTLGAVTRVEAVAGRRDEVQLTFAHASGAVSNASLSLTSQAGEMETVFWGPGGLERMPSTVDVLAAYSAAIDALRRGDTRFDARFGLEVTRVLARAEMRMRAGSAPGAPGTS